MKKIIQRTSKVVNDFKNKYKKFIFLTVFAILAVTFISVSAKIENNTLTFSVSTVYAESEGGEGCGGCGGNDNGGGSYGGGGESYGGGTSDYYWTTPTYVPPAPRCTNGYTNYPTCGPTVCTNGTTNFPNCNVCPTGLVFINNICTTIPNVTAQISANPSTVVIGNMSTLTWSSTGATYCVLTGGGINLTVGISGSRAVYPGVNTNYFITCYNAYGNLATAQTSVNVTQVVANNPTANITANPSSITLGNSTTLTWSSTNANRCVLNGGQYNNQPVGISGSLIATPNVGTNYTIQCFNAVNASASDAAYVTVNQVQNVCTNGYTNYPVCGPVYNAPTANITANPSFITQGNSTTLTWSSTNATYCVGQPFPFSGSKNISGSENVTLNQTTTFTITCFNQNGQSASAQTTVNVNTVNNDVYCNGVRYPAGTVCPNVNNSIAVSTTGANPSQTTANIFGYINPGNGNAQMYFEYGTNYNLNNRTNTQFAYSAGQFSANITGLTCGTTYYYRAVGQNNFETKYGSTQSFVTSACSNNNYTDSTVLTRSATSIYQNGAQLNGAFIYGNTNNSCTAYFQYGTDYNLGNSSNAQNLLNNSGVNYFSQAISGLSPNTRYYYRAVSNCNGQIKYGSILSFVTASHTVKKHIYVKPITKVVTAPTLCNCNTTNVDSNNVAIANTQYMDLIVERMESGAMIGGNASYRVVYKNTSSTTLQDVVIRVIFPEELTILTADRGDFSVGGNSLTYTISQLSKLEEGRINITTKVKSNLEVGRQVVVNGYANYSVPTIVKNGQLFKDEVTAYVLSVLTDSNTLNNNGGKTNNGNSINNTNDMFGGNFFQWVVLLGLILLFIITIVYLFTASKRKDTQ